MSNADINAIIYNAQLLKMTFVKVAENETLDDTAKFQQLLGVTTNLKTAAQAGLDDMYFRSAMVDICGVCCDALRDRLPEEQRKKVTAELSASLTLKT